MKKFDFKLQKLLDIRMDDEEKSKISFKKAQDEKIIAEKNLETLNSNYTKYGETRIFGSVVEQKIIQVYLNSLSLCIDEANAEVQKKDMLLEKKRQDLKEKQIDRKTVEILKEKQLDKFNKEENRIEQLANDEFALYGYMRRNVERG
jgi:flagellar FliJ protein